MAASLASARTQSSFARLQRTSRGRTVLFTLGMASILARQSFWVGPDAGEPGDALGWDREIGAGSNQDFFQATDEFDYA